MARIGRNELCPCGSGKKSKRCCAFTAAPVKRNELHDVDNRLAPLITGFARERFGASWSPLDDYPGRSQRDGAIVVELLGPWSIYEYNVDGRPAAAWFSDGCGSITAAGTRVNSTTFGN